MGSTPTRQSIGAIGLLLAGMFAGPSVGSTCSDAEKIGVERLISVGGQAAIVWTGTEYGVAWTLPLEDETTGVVFARLDTEGRILGQRVIVSDPAHGANRPSLVWTGNEFGVAWIDDRTDGGGVWFARLDPLGDPTGSTFAIGGGGSVATRIAWNGSFYAVAVEQNEKIRLIRFDTSGGQTETVVSEVGATLQSFIWNGEVYSIVWRGPFAYFMRGVDSFGVPQGPTQNISNASGAGVAVGPFRVASHVWNGDGYAVAMAMRRSETGQFMTVFRRLDSEGVPFSWTEAIVPESDVVTRGTTLSWTGTEYGVAHHLDAPSTTYFMRFDSSGAQVGDPFELTAGLRLWQAGPGLVWNSSDYAFVLEPAGILSPPVPASIWFARLGCHCVDVDGDGVSICNECDDASDAVYPGAPQLCDGMNNDCDDPDWPDTPPDELDSDGDGFSICEGDCADTDALRSPAIPEWCNAVDDDCDGLIDENDSGLDVDEDGVHGSCDNCADAFNPHQEDDDGDLVGDACDNCLFDRNASQSDIDLDLEGDQCDLDDGRVQVDFTDTAGIRWQQDVDFDSWNVYRGALQRLRDTGEYTQSPVDESAAAGFCGLVVGGIDDRFMPDPGQVLFYLVTGMSGVDESDLGTDSSGGVRPNANPCPSI